MSQVVIRLLVIISVGFVCADLAQAEPPRIAAISPSGIRRGVTTEVVVSGTNFAGSPRWLGSFGSVVQPVGSEVGKPTDLTSCKLRITPDPDVPVGVYLVRIQTEGGLSNPFPFAVDQVPHLIEVEDNSSFGLAQKVTTPAVVEGQASGSDVDYFRFSGRRGEKVVIDAVCARVGSGVDPSIRLSTLARRFVAAADDTPGLLTDARLFAELPTDGDYVVELADTRYQGAGTRTNYRLLIGRGLSAAGMVFPLGGRRGDLLPVELTGGTLPGSTPHRADVLLSQSLETEPGRVAPQISEMSGGLTILDPITSGGWFLGHDVEAMPPLAVGAAPEFRESLDPAAPAIRATLPAVFNGQIEAPRDTDVYVVTGVTPGQKVRVVLEAASFGSLLDGVVQVRGASDTILSTSDDSAIPTRRKPKLPPADPNAPKKPPIMSLDSEALVTIPAGLNEISLTVRDLEGDGGPGYPYRLTVEPVVPGFVLLASTQDQVNIPRGGTVGISVEAERTDFLGPITLKVANPPPGVTVRAGLIPFGQTVGTLSLSAAPDARFDAVTLQITGESVGPNGPIRAEATRTTILAAQAEFASGYRTYAGLPAAPTSPPPITVTGPDAVEVVLAYAATFPVRVVRSPGTEDVVLTFGSLPTVPNLAVAADPKLAAKVLDGTITINTNPDLVLGPNVVVFTARGKFGDRERTIAMPAVTVTVTLPAEIELTTPRLEIAAGTSAEIRGKVTRRGGFKDPVNLKLDALPAGIKADPLVVPPEATEFAFKVTADPKAAPTEAAARVVPAIKLGPRDYAPPAVPLVIKVKPAL